MGYTKKINNGDYTPKEMPRSASIPPPPRREERSIPQTTNTPPPNKSGNSGKK